MLHSPLRFGAFAGMGVGVSRFDLLRAFSEGFVSGVAGEVDDVLSSFGESHLFIRYRRATAPPPSMTASRTMTAKRTHRCEGVEDCEGLEVILAGVSGAATVGEIKVGSESGSAKRVEPSSKQKFSESSLYLLLQLGHRFMEIRKGYSFLGDGRVHNERGFYFPDVHATRNALASLGALAISSRR